MIKVIIFDLDGVLVDTKKIHYEALNESLKKNNFKFISYKDHLSLYDGLTTKEKLKIYFNKKNLNSNKINQILNDKKKFTNQKLYERINYSPKIFKLFKLLSKDFKILIASNAIKPTIQKCIKKLKLTQFIKFYLSGEDINKPKPHPSIYTKCFFKLGVSPKECLIVEDSFHGIAAAVDSGGNVLQIKNTKELSLSLIKKEIKSVNSKNKKIDWTDKRLNILIPMAGEGSRFKKVGYTFPKPLIEIKKKTMIQVVIDNLKIDANYNFVVKEKHIREYNIDSMLKILKPNCNISIIKRKTRGAAETALVSEKFINNKNPLLIANSDQFVEWDNLKSLYQISLKKIDGAIFTFKSTHPKWSYAKHNSKGEVTEVAEKKVISNTATVGFYYWKKGSDFVKYAKKMIKKNIRYKNEFYICPVYNEAIKENKKIIIQPVKEMWGLGTPEDLDVFLKNYKGNV